MQGHSDCDWRLLEIVVVLEAPRGSDPRRLETHVLEWWQTGMKLGSACLLATNTPRTVLIYSTEGWVRTGMLLLAGCVWLGSKGYVTGRAEGSDKKKRAGDQRVAKAETMRASLKGLFIKWRLGSRANTAP